MCNNLSGLKVNIFWKKSEIGGFYNCVASARVSIRFFKLSSFITLFYNGNEYQQLKTIKNLFYAFSKLSVTSKKLSTKKRLKLLILVQKVSNRVPASKLFIFHL